MKLLVSACLLGQNCKYSGGNNYSEKLDAYCKIHGCQVVPVCPEELGGLPTPRLPSELVSGVVTAKDGTSVDAEFRLGAEKALAIAREQNVDCAVLQSRSPSCGVNEVYDGTFSGKRVPGMGVFARLLRENGFQVIDIEDLD